MPKTRNVTRAQWDSAHASHASATTTTTRSRRPKENGQDSEKENGSRKVTHATRSQTTRARTGVLATLSSNATLGLGPAKGTKATTKTQTATKGKGKPKVAPLKRKKMPLQDITSQFLPAPEPANRGVDHQNLTEEDFAIAHAEPANIISALAPVEAPLAAPKFTSPLPPSSPPSPLISSPIHEVPAELIKKLFTFPLASPTHSIPQEPCVNSPAAYSSSRSASSASDPFGFVALERKLKAEREFVLAQHDLDVDAVDEYDELDHVLVADTSSPRPVPRLKRPLYVNAAEGEDNEEQNTPSDSLFPSADLTHVHYATPPTPHKDKQKRRHLSHEGHDIFSPCESSVESSPSPTKASAKKRPFQETREDPLDEFNDELERSQLIEPEELPKKTRRTSVEADAGPDAVSRNLRTRVKKSAYEDTASHSSPKRTHAIKLRAKKAAAKPRTAAKKEKVEASDDEAEDLDEKWERERQERVEYFERLEEYEVEEESIYIV